MDDTSTTWFGRKEGSVYWQISFSITKKISHVSLRRKKILSGRAQKIWDSIFGHDIKICLYNNDLTKAAQRLRRDKKSHFLEIRLEI